MADLITSYDLTVGGQSMNTNCSFDLAKLPLGSYYTAMASSLLSIVGSVLVILSFICWRDLRTVARAILVFLAIADFLSAAGYIFGSIIFLAQYNHSTTFNNISVSPALCTLQSFITTAFPISSFIWTANLAVYLFVAITLKKVQLAKKLVLLFHITAWGIPLLLCIPGAIANVLGQSGQSGQSGLTQGTVGWCWVSFNDTYTENSTIQLQDAYASLTHLHILELVYGKFWEISISSLALILCISVKVSLYKMKKQANKPERTEYGSHDMKKKINDAIVQLDQKLIWIPIVFILFRFWGTFRWFIASLDPECNKINLECSLRYQHIWFQTGCLNLLYSRILLYMQSIGDTGQGWANALLYFIFNATIARRLFPCFFRCGKTLSDFFCSLKHQERCSYERLGDNDHRQLALSVSKNSWNEEDVIHDKASASNIVIAPDASSINAKNI